MSGLRAAWGARRKTVAALKPAVASQSATRKCLSKPCSLSGLHTETNVFEHFEHDGPSGATSATFPNDDEETPDSSEARRTESWHPSELGTSHVLLYEERCHRAACLLHCFPEGPSVFVEGFWSQIPFRVWCLGPETLNIWDLDPLGTVSARCNSKARYDDFVDWLGAGEGAEGPLSQLLKTSPAASNGVSRASKDTLRPCRIVDISTSGQCM